MVVSKIKTQQSLPCIICRANISTHNALFGSQNAPPGFKQACQPGLAEAYCVEFVCFEE
jgi:hypothetical protein